MCGWTVIHMKRGMNRNRNQMEIIFIFRWFEKNCTMQPGIGKTLRFIIMISD